jgi:hypothetical protein
MAYLEKAGQTERVVKASNTGLFPAWTAVPASAELPRVLGGVAMDAELLAAGLEVGDSFGESVAVVGDRFGANLAAIGDLRSCSVSAGA